MGGRTSSATWASTPPDVARSSRDLIAGGLLNGPSGPGLSEQHSVAHPAPFDKVVGDVAGAGAGALDRTD